MKYANEKEAKDAGLKVIAYDLDGTLAEYDGGGDGSIGDPIFERLHEMSTSKLDGAYIIIYTTRLNERLWGSLSVQQERKKIMDWLNMISFSEYVDLLVGDKPLADEYHDDRAVPLKPIK